MDIVLECLTQPVNTKEWAEATEYGIESDTGENSRQYLKDKLLMSFREFAESLSEKAPDGPNNAPQSSD